MAVERNLATARVRIVADARDLAKDTKKILEESLGDAGDKSGTNFGRRMKKQVDDAAADAGQKSGRKLADKFGDAMNRSLRALNLPDIDIKANPKDALDAIERTERRLRDLSTKAATVEIKANVEKALAEVTKVDRLLNKNRTIKVDVDQSRFDQAFAFLAGKAAALFSKVFRTKVNIDVDQNRIAGKFERFFVTVGKKASSVFSSIFNTNIGALLGPELVAGIVVAIAAIAPLLGGVIAGAVIGAAGLGGVIGGLIVAARDARVKSAGKELAANLLDRLEQASGAFINPALDGINTIKRAIDTINIEKIFAKAAEFVAPIASGLASMVKSLGDALGGLIDKAGPVMDALGRGLARVGASLAAGLGSLSDNGKEAAAALDELFLIIDVLIRYTFNFVNALTEAYGWMRKIGTDTGLVLIMKLLGTSTDKTAKSTSVLGATFEKVADDVALQKAQQAALKVVTDGVKNAQDALAATLARLGGATSLAGQKSTALKTAMDNLFGATMRNADANVTYQQSWDDVTKSVKDNKTSLDIHTQAGRNNYTAMKNLLVASGDLYISNIAAGQSVDSARKKHEARTEAIKKEAEKLGLNKTKTQELINTYGKIPPAKTTDLILAGVAAVVTALNRLYIYQRALQEGKSTTAIEQIIRTGSDRGPSKKGGGFAAGGQIGGYSPSSTADNIHAMLTAKEWVHPVDSVDYYGPAIMEAIQKRQVPREVLTAFASGTLGKMGDLPFFATGGLVANVDTSRRWPFVADMSHTRVPSMKEVASKVPLGAGPGGAFVRAQNGKPYIWASAGPTGYDCSGIVSAVYNVLHGRSPYSHTFSTGSLPGKWFPKSGIGGPLTAAWSNPGQYPASSTTGHMMGMVGGLTFESSGSRGVHLGSSTRRLTDFAHRAHYAGGGYVVPSYDTGGVWPADTLGANTSGRDEHVTTGAERDRQTELLARIVVLLEMLGPEISNGVGRALMGTASAGRAARRRAGRSAYA